MSEDEKACIETRQRALEAISFLSSTERDLVVATLRAIRDRESERASHEGRVIAHRRRLTYLGELSTLGTAVLAIVDFFGVDALNRIADGATHHAEKFCAHCKARRSLEETVHSLATTAVHALAQDTSTEDGARKFEFASTQVLATLADLAEAEGKAAAE